MRLVKVQEWVRRTFGIPRDPNRILERTREELLELEEAVRGSTSEEEVGFEIADVVITLCQLANYYGVNLDLAIENKMSINKARRWRKLGDGTGYHIK